MVYIARQYDHARNRNDFSEQHFRKLIKVLSLDFKKKSWNRQQPIGVVPLIPEELPQYPTKFPVPPVAFLLATTCPWLDVAKSVISVENLSMKLRSRRVYVRLFLLIFVQFFFESLLYKRSTFYFCLNDSKRNRKSYCIPLW